VTGLTLSIALLCFGASITIAPQSPSGRRVDAAGALGPAVLALGPAGYGIASTAAVLVPAVLVLFVAETVRSRSIAIKEAAGRSILLVASAAMLARASAFAGAPLIDRGKVALLAGVAAAAAVFPAGDWLWRTANLVARRSRGLGAGLYDEMRASAPLHIVFFSTAGLVALSYDELGFLAFVVLLLPLVATDIAFSRYAAARETYAQTVRALGKLTETAGYVKPGHHERVANLCVDVARELGLPGERVRRIELAALLHDVGTVSVADPAELATTDAAVVARAGARVLEETGYLAGQARLIAAQSASPHEATSIDARILRVASAFDDADDGSVAVLSKIAEHLAPEDARAFDALQRVVTRTRLRPV
jgi:hypothetical protein